MFKSKLLKIVWVILCAHISDCPKHCNTNPEVTRIIKAQSQTMCMCPPLEPGFDVIKVSHWGNIYAVQQECLLSRNLRLLCDCCIGHYFSHYNKYIALTRHQENGTRCGHMVTEGGGGRTTDTKMIWLHNLGIGKVSWQEDWARHSWMYLGMFSRFLQGL